jgi:hypothetical protein
LNLVEYVIVAIEQMSESPISFDIHVELIFVLHVKIDITFDTFSQHLPKTFFQPKVGEMEIDKMLVRIKVQNLHIDRWIVTEEEQLTKINLGFKEKFATC